MSWIESSDGGSFIATVVRETRAVVGAAGFRPSLAAIAGAAAVAAGLGVLFAPAVLDRSGGRFRALRPAILALLCAPLALPPVALAGLFSYVTRLGPATVPNAGQAFQRHLALAATWIVMNVPWTTMIAALIESRRPAALAKFETATFGRAARRRFAFRRARGTFVFAALVTAAAAFTDLASPAHFGVETPASAIGWRFQTSLDGRASVAAFLPWWILPAIAVALARPRGDRREEGGTATTAAGPAHLCLLAFVIVGVLLPIGRLMPEIARAGRNLPKLGAPIIETAIAAGLGAFAGTLTALLLMRLSIERRAGAFGRGAAAFLLASGFFCPGLVRGYLALRMSMALPAIDPAAVQRAGALFPAVLWAALVFILTGRSRSVDAGRALGLLPNAVFGRHIRGAGRRTIALAGVAGAAAMLREIDYATAFALPGGETLAVRLAQLLHFGFSPEAAAMTISLYAAAAVFGMIAVVSLRKSE